MYAIGIFIYDYLVDFYFGTYLLLIYLEYNK